MEKGILLEDYNAGVDEMTAYKWKEKEQKYKETLTFGATEEMLKRKTSDSILDEEFKSMEGYLYKRQTRKLAVQPNWKNYYFHFKSDQLLLSYYSSKEDFKKNGKPRGRELICWVSLETAKDLTDSLAKKQLKRSVKGRNENIIISLGGDPDEDEEVCKYRLWIFTERRVLLVSGKTNELVEAWAESLIGRCKQAFDTKMAAKKERAAEKLRPLLKKQREVQMLKIQKALEEIGITTGACPIKSKKQGKLELESVKNPGVWRTYYFMLVGEKKQIDLLYFNLDDEERRFPKGIIPLQAVIQCDLDDTDPCRFSLVTPLKTYHLKSKHSEARADWIVEIDPSFSDELRENTMEQGGEPVGDGKVMLEFQQGNKWKKAKMKGPSMIIGRSTSSELALTEDPQVSRNHVRLERNVSGVIWFYDLGSGSGTKLNGERKIKSPLASGDVITMGQTDLRFKIIPGKNKKRR